MKRKKIVILGAAGRDFHNFNTLYRKRRDVEVVAFTATQIPDIEGRKYPASLAGPLYPKGIPIVSESELPRLIEKHGVEEALFAYSDVSNQYVMEKAALVNALGAHFTLAGGAQTMIKSAKPVISICAVRTGSGKSQTTRKVARILVEAGRKVVAIRHPMPYGNLAKQKVQRFATLDDLLKNKCTIEEIEEYEPHIVRGVIVYAGVDYEAIMRKAEREADVVLWDGGNNDLPFYRSDLHIVVADPHRAGHEITYYPGLTNLLLADCIVINKIDTADLCSIEAVRESVARLNPKAVVIDGASPIRVDRADRIKGKRVLCVEDGPTLTHGGMRYGAAVMAARKYHAKEIVDPRPYVTGKIVDTFRKYPDIGPLLPAMGYGPEQVKDLQKTISRVPCDLVIIGTPIDLERYVKIQQPALRVMYDLQEIGHPDLKDVLKGFIKT